MLVFRVESPRKEGEVKNGEGGNENWCQARRWGGIGSLKQVGQEEESG